MYITRERHTKTLPLIPAYVAAGQHKALSENRQRINTLERKLSRWPEWMAYGVCMSWIIGFLCGLLLWR